MLTARPSLVRVACVVLAAAMLAAFAILSQDPAFDIAEATTAAAAGVGVLVLAALAYVVARTGRRSVAEAPGADDEHARDERNDAALIDDEPYHSSSPDVDGVAAVEFAAPATISRVVFDPARVAEEEPAAEPAAEASAPVVEPDDTDLDLEPITAEVAVDPAPVIAQADPTTHRAAVPVDAPTPARPPAPEAAPVVAVEPFRAPTLADAEAVEPTRERAIQLHIRTLEAALEEQSTRLAQAHLQETSQPGRDMERVLLTIGALRERMKASPESESVLNRVEAAVARLALTSATRPALPAVIPVERRRLAAPAEQAMITAETYVAPPAALSEVGLAPLTTEVGLAPLTTEVGLAPLTTEVGLAPLPATVSEAALAAPVVAEPALAPQPLEDASPVHTPPQFEPSAPTPHIEERVLPVPAPVAAPAAHGSRWRRRRAA